MLKTSSNYKRICKEIDNKYNIIKNILNLNATTYLYIDGEMTSDPKLLLRICIDGRFEKMLFQLNISNNYPFQPYKLDRININDKIITHYPQFLCTLSRNLKNYRILYQYLYILLKSPPKLLNYIEKNNCMCCNSITCHNNWMPSKTFIDMVYEYNEIKIICHLNNLNLNNIYNSTRLSLLPNEIIDIILETIDA